MSCITASTSPTGYRRRGRVEPPLHHRPLPAGQGDRPDRRGAAARIKMEIDSKPESMDKLDRRIIQLKIEREAVKRRTRPRSSASA